jgi:hypothetical protein
MGKSRPGKKEWNHPNGGLRAGPMFDSWLRRCMDPYRTRHFQTVIFLLLLLLVTGCAPALYSIDLRHMPSDNASPADTSGRKFIVTVATFNDKRPGGEDLLIGRVTTAMGGMTSVIPETMTPADAVSTIVKDVLIQSGYQVSVAMPAWNLQEKDIQQHGGKILIGGNIDELEVVCQNDIPLKTYEARVGLTIVFADVQTGKIFHKVSTASKHSLEHIYFSETLLGQQLSSAITEAVEKAFTGQALKRKIQDVLK